MNTLLETNIVLRAAQPSHVQYHLAVDAVDVLLRRGETLCLVPQNLYEFWVVATKPAAQNGLGMSVTEAQAELTRLRAIVAVCDDTPAILPEWERLVVQHHVVGKPAHDARLVAAMTMHGIGRILTFCAGDFVRYPAITVLTPQDVLASSAPPTT